MDRMLEEVILRIFTIGCEREIEELEFLENIALDTFPHKTTYPRRRKPFAALVSQICRRWNDIINSRRAKHLWITSVAIRAIMDREITRWKKSLEPSGMEECDIDVCLNLYALPSRPLSQVVFQQVLDSIAMLVPFTRRLRSLVVMSNIPEVIDLIISIVSVPGATPQMDILVISGPQESNSPPPASQSPASFRGEGLKRVSLAFRHLPPNLALSPYLHGLLCYSMDEWSQIERLLRPLQVLQKLNLGLYHIARPPPPQETITHSPILFDSLASLEIWSKSIHTIRDFLFSVCTPSLTMLKLDYQDDVKSGSGTLSLHSLHNHFVLPPRVSLGLQQASHFPILLSFLDFQWVESLSIILSGQDAETDDIPNEGSHSQVSPPLQAMSSLRFLDVDSHTIRPLSAGQFFREVGFRPDVRLRIAWDVLQKIDPQILRRASVFELHSLELSLGLSSSCNKDILRNFQSLTKLVVSLPALVSNCELLKNLILPTSEDCDCSDTTLILPRLADLECKLPSFDCHDSRNHIDKECRKLQFCMAQITESRRSRGISLKRVILVDDRGTEIDF